MAVSQPRITADEEFFLALTSAYARVTRLMEEAINGAGLTIAEYTMLRIINNTPGVTASEARARLFATAPSVAQLIERLERKRCIRRVRDENDSRKLHLHLSSEGAKRLQKGRKAIVEFLSSLSLPPSLLSSLSKDLSTLLSSLPPHGSR